MCVCAEIHTYIYIYAEAENPSFLCQDEIQTLSNRAKT